jgi:hypothetical protein
MARCHTRWPVSGADGAFGESHLLALAKAFLEAPDEQIVTSAEWDRLRKPITAAR